MSESKAEASVETNLELSWVFKGKTEEGKTIDIEVPRVKTRGKYRIALGMVSSALEKLTLAALGEALVQNTVPWIYDLEDSKSLTTASYSELFMKIFDIDGEAILGKEGKDKFNKTVEDSKEKKSKGNRQERRAAAKTARKKG